MATRIANTGPMPDRVKRKFQIYADMVGHPKAHSVIEKEYEKRFGEPDIDSVLNAGPVTQYLQSGLQPENTIETFITSK